MSGRMSLRTMMCDSPRVLSCMAPPPFLNLPFIYSLHISMKSLSQKSAEHSVLTLGDSVFHPEWLADSGDEFRVLVLGCHSQQELGKARVRGHQVLGPRGWHQFLRNQSVETLLWVPGTGLNRLGTWAVVGWNGHKSRREMNQSKTPRTPESENVVLFFYISN